MLEERKVGDREPVTVTAFYPSAVDLNGAIVTFWMRKLGAPDGEWKVQGGTGTLEDVSAELGLAAGVAWRFEYPFTLADVSEPGRYSAWFRADFGAQQYRYAPNDQEVVLVSVSGQAAA